MSTSGRAYDLLRAYVHTAHDRIFGGEETEGRAEFERELEATLPPLKSPPATPEEIPRSAAKALDPLAARKILGVGEAANFAEIKRQYDQLIERCNPDRFEKGSEDARQAANIRTRVAAAYRVLSESADSVDRRFGTLELD